MCGEELTEGALVNVCRECWSRLTPWQGPGCVRCGLPFASGRALEAADAKCAPCRREEFDFDFARSYGIYSGALREIVLQMKFHRRERLGRRLGELMALVWPPDLSTGDPPVIIPVPLHRSRLRERGFNQAQLLVDGLVEKLATAGLGREPRVEARCLGRTRATLPQAGLSLAKRRENVSGVFGVEFAERIRDRTVVLVDDVMTTGATLSACAHALKQAGARRVVGLTLARAAPAFPDGLGARDPEALDELSAESR